MNTLHVMSRARLTLPALAAALVLFFALASASGAHAGGPRADPRTQATRTAGGPAVAAIPPDTPPVRDSQPFAVLLCRFSDSDPMKDPHPAAYFEQMLRSSRPGLDHYWREVSYGEIDLVGSRVFAWKNLPGRYDAYVTSVNGEPRAEYHQIGDDCIAAHDNPGLDFAAFKGIAVIYDRAIDEIGRGIPMRRSLDGQDRNWSMVWLDAQTIDQRRLAHEMGHSFGDFGLTHSSGSSGQTYDSKWDVMSGGYDVLDDDEVPQEFPFGNVAVHTIAAHKDFLGWIPAERKFTLAPGRRAFVTLARLAQPGDGGMLLAKVPIQGSTTAFYTAELRQNRERFDSNSNFKVSYDDGTPAPQGGAVVIHKVDYALKDGNARVVDGDGNTDPNDSGAMWLAGETFADPANGVTIQVNSINREAGTAVITVDNTPSLTIADVTVSEPSAPNGTSQARFTVRLSNASSQAIGLDYVTAAGTATKDVDYAHVADGHLSIPAGAKTATITINVKIDTLKESSETFFLNLKNPIGAAIADAQAKGTILDRPPASPAPTPAPCPPPAVNCQEP